MNAIMDITKVLRLSEKRLFGEESKCNCKLTQLQVFGLLLLFPCFMIRNAYNYSKSSLSSLFVGITALQYNLLSNARRFSDYETVGGLFKDATMGSVELTLTERIWDMILEMVRMIAECFNIEDEEILDTLLNRSDKLSHFVEIYQLKQAS